MVRSVSRGVAEKYASHGRGEPPSQNRLGAGVAIRPQPRDADSWTGLPNDFMGKSWWGLPRASPSQ